MKNAGFKHLGRFAAILFIIAINGSCSKVSTKQNTVSQSTEAGAAIGDFFPKSGLANTVVKITGRNFKTGPNDVNTVDLNGIPVTINAIKSDTITVTVPPNAISGVFTVRSGTSLVSTSDVFTVTTGYVTILYNLSPVHMEHLVLDQNGNFYGNDIVNTVFKLTPDGQISVLGAANGDKSHFQHIIDLTVAPSGDIFLLEAYYKNIIKVNINTPLITSVVAGGVADSNNPQGIQGYDDGVGTSARFFSLTSVTHDGLGNLFITDGHRVRKITAAGVVTTIAGNAGDGNSDGRGANAQFGTLEGIAVDSEGNLYVTDSRYFNVRKIAPNGTVTTFAGSGRPGFADGQGTAAQFTYPRGIVADASDNIFVTDQDATNRIYKVRKINKLGLVTTFIQGFTDGPVVGGAPNEATVNSAHGLTVDAAGNLYILSTGVNTISKVTFK